MTPAENKQTVEAALGLIASTLRSGEPMSLAVEWKVERGRVALRDLVAQADRAAELEAALRVVRPNLKTIAARTTDREPDKHFIRMLANEAIMEIDALAGDGGGA